MSEHNAPTTKIITIFCLVHSDDPFRNPFSIKIPNTATVDELKQRVHAIRGLNRRKFSYVHLTLWKLFLSIDQLAKLHCNFDFKTDGVELSPFCELSSIFVDEPADGHVHIIAELPPPTPLPRPGIYTHTHTHRI